MKHFNDSINECNLQKSNSLLLVGNKCTAKIPCYFLPGYLSIKVGVMRKGIVHHEQNRRY